MRSSDQPIVVGDVELYPGRQEARRRGRVVLLTPVESSLLKLMMRRPNHLISIKLLARAVWGSDVDRSGSIRVHIFNLRKKLEPEGAFIEGRRSSGYMVTA